MLSGVIADLKMYGRFALGLRRFLRERISLDEARDLVRDYQVQREPNFLRLVRRGVFGNPRSPYLPSASAPPRTTKPFFSRRHWISTLG